MIIINNNVTNYIWKGIFLSLCLTFHILSQQWPSGRERAARSHKKVIEKDILWTFLFELRRYLPQKRNDGIYIRLVYFEKGI